MSRSGVGLVLLLFIAGMSPDGVAARQAQAPERLRVFLDCFRCDFDYIRTEMPFVDYMRDRTDADVHILVTQQGVGAGGQEYTLNFIGLRTFTGIADTLRYVSTAEDTDDVRRRGLTRVLMMGMMPYVAATPLAPRIVIALAEDEGPVGTVPSQGEDPWNFWVFEVGADFNREEESLEKEQEAEFEFSANRTTEDWKIDIRLDGSYSERDIERDEGDIFTSIRRSYGADFLIVGSVGPHFSVGMEGDLNSSTFGNEKLSFALGPAVEYNVFPYAESTRRRLTVLYEVGFQYFDWREISVFNEVRETRPAHRLAIGYSTRQPWGNLGGSINLSQFLHDTQKNRISFDGNGNVRLWRGLNLNFGASYSRIRDQLSIPKRDATDEEVFLRLRQLRTDFRVDVRFGLSYRFGSIFNNVVNPRFRRGFGGGRF